MEWYKFTPVDTLFFRGAEPMVIGENHTVSHVFPPPAHTISGALRTAVLIQHGITFENYGKGEAPDDILSAIGMASSPAPFDLIGPLFIIDDKLYVPAPYSWFINKGSDEKSRNGKISIIKGKPINSRLLKTPAEHLLWAKGEENKIDSLGGNWIKADDLYSDGKAVVVKHPADLFKDEPRTGIGLERNRKAREGHLYSFNHSRLKMNVNMIFGTDKGLPLQDKGVLKVGAEQRFGWYEKIKNAQAERMVANNAGDNYLSLSVVEGTEEANASIVATGKILYFGGWDLNIGFHKSMKGYFPAGTVFNKKLNNNLIDIRG